MELWLISGEVAPSRFQGKVKLIIQTLRPEGTTDQTISIPVIDPQISLSENPFTLTVLDQVKGWKQRVESIHYTDL